MTRRLKASRGTAHVCAQITKEHEAEATRVVRELVRLLAPLLAAELSTTMEGDPWIDQYASPLGKRLHCELARSHAFDARRVGRRWLARRSALDAYILAQRPAALPAPPPANDLSPEGDNDRGVCAVLAEVGLVALPRAARGRRP